MYVTSSSGTWENREMGSELDFDRLGDWLLVRQLSIHTVHSEAGKPFHIYFNANCVGQGVTLSEALRDAGALASDVNG